MSNATNTKSNQISTQFLAAQISFKYSPKTKMGTAFTFNNLKTNN